MPATKKAAGAGPGKGRGGAKRINEVSKKQAASGKPSIKHKAAPSPLKPSK